VYSAIVLTVNLKVLFYTSSHSVISFTLFFLSILSYYLVLLIMSSFYRFDNFNNSTMLFTNIRFYLSTLVMIVLIFTLDIGINKVLISFGVIKDAKTLKAEKIDEQMNEEKVSIRCKDINVD